LLACDPEALAAASFWFFLFSEADGVAAAFGDLAGLFLGALCAGATTDRARAVRRIFEMVVMRGA